MFGLDGDPVGGFLVGDLFGDLPLLGFLLVGLWANGAPIVDFVMLFPAAS